MVQKLKREKWTAFCPSPIGQKLPPEKSTAFCPTRIGNNSHKPFHNSCAFRLYNYVVLLAPPPDSCLRSMGQHHFPSHAPPLRSVSCRVWGLRGWGNLESFSSRYVRIAPKKQDWIWAAPLSTHLCDSTVAPHSPHSGRGFHGCRRRVGECRRISAAFLRALHGIPSYTPKS